MQGRYQIHSVEVPIYSRKFQVYSQRFIHGRSEIYSGEVLIHSVEVPDSFRGGSRFSQGRSKMYSRGVIDSLRGGGPMESLRGG